MQLSTIRAESEDITRLRKVKHTVKANNDTELIYAVSLILQEIGEKDISKVVEKLEKKGILPKKILTYAKDGAEEQKEEES